MPAERDLGAELVYQFRLLTPQRNLLDIRIDARTGRFLSVAGRGQLAARKPVE
ncbi:PepSY domain-containing protein [Paracoccus sp. (in: a-proteobacteria)]|uniref:PepSY domain-containing protein n=1 Tax=Paracoccus sp. TaxID=267 RepID=UPI0035AF9FEE